MPQQGQMHPLQPLSHTDRSSPKPRQLLLIFPISEPVFALHYPSNHQRHHLKLRSHLIISAIISNYGPISDGKSQVAITYASISNLHNSTAQYDYHGQARPQCAAAASSRGERRHSVLGTTSVHGVEAGTGCACGMAQSTHIVRFVYCIGDPGTAAGDINYRCVPWRKQRLAEHCAYQV